MWKRVHLAIIQGPDLGEVIEIGAAGTGISGSGLTVRVGRAAIADATIADPALSRIHFTAQACTHRFGRVGVRVHPTNHPTPGGSILRAWLAKRAVPAWIPRWVPRARRGRFHRIGSRFRYGETRFEVRTDAPPPIPRKTSHTVTRFLPLGMSLGFVTMWLLPGVGPWPLVLGALLMPVGMILASRSPRSALPDPARLLYSKTMPPLDPASGNTGIAIDLGNTVTRRKRRLTLLPGQVFASAGEGAPGLIRWISAQLLLSGAQEVEPGVFVLPAAAGLVGGAGLVSEPVAARSGRRAGAVVLEHAPTPALLRSTPTVVIPAGARHNRDVGQEWYENFATTGAVQGADLADHLPELGHLVSQWRAHDEHLSAPVGVDVTSGALHHIDLAGDAPHAIIAGTTGAGKSVLLTSWLLGIAARYPPTAVSMVLIDYKGGATFGPLADLPHVLDVLTDLDHSATVRALESLRVEIHRRERLLARAGVAEILEFNTGGHERMARLLVVVDEFRVLADEYPTVLDGLVRVAAQGRSLGIHVVLATQRPSGAMTPDIRANMGIRACLRVVEETDSIDLLGSAGAAHLPAIPGRMILRTDSLHTVQTLWDAECAPSVVEACLNAARSTPGHAQVHRPWAPPLPQEVAAPPAASPGNIALGIADLPAEQRHGTWEVPAQGVVIISGEVGSGRSTAARVLTRGALGNPGGVHVIGARALLPQPEDDGGALGAWQPPPSFIPPGSFIPLSDPPAAIALLERIRSTPGPDALVIDDVESLVDSLEGPLGHGEGSALLSQVLRASRAHGRLVVLTTGIPAPTWIGPGERVLFPPTDPHLRLLADLPSDTGALPPGRAIATRGGQHTFVQVANPPVDHNPVLSTRETLGRQVPGVGVPESAAAQFVITPLPTTVDLPLNTSVEEMDAPVEGMRASVDGPRVCIGVGGTQRDLIGITLELGRVTVIMGTAGSGRSRLARLIQARADLAVEPRSPGGSAIGSTHGTTGAFTGPEVLLVQDVHTVSPEELDSHESTVAAGAHAVITTTPEGITAGFHPFLTRVRHSQTVIYSSEIPRSLAPVNLARYLTANIPGRGVLMHRGTYTPVHLDRCSQLDNQAGRAPRQAEQPEG